jgi:hypothetical protein
MKNYVFYLKKDGWKSPLELVLFKLFSAGKNSPLQKSQINQLQSTKERSVDIIIKQAIEVTNATILASLDFLSLSVPLFLNRHKIAFCRMLFVTLWLLGIAPREVRFF